MRVQRGNAVTLASPTFVGADGETPTDADSLPTCAVTREDGTALANATVTNLADAGNYTAALTAATHTPSLDVLTVTWSGVVGGAAQVYAQVVEVVGAHYVTVPELRAMPSLSDNNKYPVALLVDMRDEFAELVETICGTAFVRRYARDLIDGEGLDTVQLSHLHPRQLLSVTQNGVSQSLSDFTLYDSGQLKWNVSSFLSPAANASARNIVVKYEHGYDLPPVQLRRQALKVIRADLLAQTAAGVPENVIMSQFEGMTIRYSTPNPQENRPTGVLSLDPILYDLIEKLPGIA